jgi:hypothetical protein
LGVILLLGAALSACDDEAPARTESAAEAGAPEPAAASKLTASSKLVFSDDFEDGTLAPEWTRGKGEGGQGQWTIEDGGVLGVDLHNDPLWLNKKLPEDVRIEFDIEALSPVGDLKVEVFGDGVNHESGYILIFGGWTNTLDVIARLDEHGRDRKARKTRGVMPGHVYHMAVDRTDSTLHWFVNGEHFMSYEDSEPLVGEGHRYFAFNNWSAPVRFDNVTVYDLSP